MKSFAHFTQTSFFGRPYEELLLCFGLEENDLKGKEILECPSGPSSFVVDANQAGILATGCDPMFYRSPDAIEKLAYTDFEDMFLKIQSKREFIVAKTYQSIGESKRIRMEALKRFLAHYRSAFPVGRYVCAALPDLPFADQSFDITLCGHLLFIYSNLFDLDFCYRSIRELCRVSREEVRIHPIVDSSGETYGQLRELRERIEDLGHATEILDVDHEFFRGANQTLRILVNRKKSKRSP